MIYVDYQGNRFDPATFVDKAKGEVLEAMLKAMREQVGSIRDPETGELPTIVIRAQSLSDIQLHIEGSEQLIAIVRAKLGVGDGGSEESAKETNPSDPLTQRTSLAFLSYASENRPFAKTIADGLMNAGIDTWWDRWEIRTGESLLERIQEGLGGCTHFLVLLTPESINKPWVNLELNAAFLRVLNDNVKLLPVRAGLGVSELPIFLRTFHCPEIDVDGFDLAQLINDIHGVARKPPLGTRPVAVRSTSPRYSPAAMCVAALFVERTQKATELDPQFERKQLLRELTNLSEDDLTDAIHELHGWVEETQYTGACFISAKPALYADFDVYSKPWNPAADALLLAADLVNDKSFPTSPDAIAARYGWEPRRLNPALTYLQLRALIEDFQYIGNLDYVCARVTATAATRRFVKSRADGAVERLGCCTNQASTMHANECRPVDSACDNVREPSKGTTMRDFLQQIVDDNGLSSQRDTDPNFALQLQHYEDAKAKGWIVDASQPHKSSEDGSGIDLIIVKALTPSGLAELKRQSA